MKRRKFLRDSLFATGMACARKSISRAFTDLPEGMKTAGKKTYLHSPHLSLEYDVSRGQASLSLAQAKPLLLNATTATVFPRGMAFASDGNYSRRARTTICRGANIVSLLAIYKKRKVPQVLSTDRRYTQGAQELENVHWDAATRTLSGAGLGALGTTRRLAIYVPEEYGWANKDVGYSINYGNFTAISYE